MFQSRPPGGRPPPGGGSFFEALISREHIAKVRQGDLDAMAELDAMGIFPGVGETAAAFAGRLETLNRNTAKMEEALRQRGKYTVEGVTVAANSRIPAAVFAGPLAHTGRLFGFRCDWVPGFFFTARPLSFFGGYAFYFFPEFFAMFMARREFAKKPKFLFIDRDELVAHEMCHIARASLESHAFEELFAYQTAATGFRRFAGGVFREQSDSFLFLGATFFLLFWQMLRAFLLPQLPASVGWLVLAADLLFLVLRHLRTYRQFLRAREKLASLYGDAAAARAVLFHASDSEIPRLAANARPDRLLEEWSGAELRWQVVRKRFPWPTTES